MSKLFIKRIYAVYVMKNKKWILFNYRKYRRSMYNISHIKVYYNKKKEKNKNEYVKCKYSYI